jgi:predicted TIM-barrel fold metal-dependent hydrolase
VAYLSLGWRDYISNRGPAGMMPLTVQDGLPNPHGFMRADTNPPNGSRPGSEHATMRRQVLDRGDVRRPVLTFGDDSHVAALHNPYLATELARGLNDSLIDRWLSSDPPLVSSILVARQFPDQAAAEIRHADNPRIMHVMLVDRVASDYPHWDADESEYIAAQLPVCWHRRIFFENAMNFYSWQEAGLATVAEATLT